MVFPEERDMGKQTAKTIGPACYPFSCRCFKQ